MFDHGTDMHELALPVVEQLCKDLGIELKVGSIGDDRPSGKSPEEHWRDQRYAWLHEFSSEVATGHNLDDVAETYLWGAVNFYPRLIPFRRNNVIRPLLAVRKAELEEYCQKHGLNYVKDPSNSDPRYTRARTREALLPAAEHVNPGFVNGLRRRVRQAAKESAQND